VVTSTKDFPLMYGFRKSLAHECFLKTTRTPKKPLVCKLWRTDGPTDARFNRLRQMHVSNQTPVTQFIPNDHGPYFNAQQNGGAANLRTLDLNARDVFRDVHVFNITAWPIVEDPLQIMGCSDKTPGGL